MATAGAHVLQWPTPRIAASPFALDRVPRGGIVVAVVGAKRDHLGGDGRHVVAEPGLHLLEELDRIVEPAIDEVDRLVIEALEPRPPPSCA